MEIGLRAVSVLAVLAAVLVAGAASQEVGNPWSTKAALKLRNTGLVQQQDKTFADADDPDVAGTDMLTDERVVEERFGATPVNVENLKDFIKQRGVSDVGLLNDLISRAACIVRLEADMGERVSADSLRSYLASRELPVSAGKDDQLDRACDYQAKEALVRRDTGKPVADISKEDLRTELQTLGFVTTQGTKAELVYRLGKALHDIGTIKQLTGDEGFDTSNVKDVLSARGLPADGSTGELLGRLASYLVEVSQSTGVPGVSSLCDVVFSGSVCLAGGKKVVGSDAETRGLVGKWTFDDAHGLDHSGKGNHLRSAPAFGPGLLGMGSSAHLDGSTMLEAQHSDHFDSGDFCMTMWIYLLADATGNWRTIAHKGNQDHERTPTFLLEPLTRGLEFFVSTTDANQPAGERLWSNTFVPLRRWTHIAGCAEGRNLRLYVNGILDAENTTIGTPVLNKGPLYLGNDPWRTEGGVAAYLDEVRYYTRSLSVDEIQAQAHLALGGVEPAFVELGCMGCSLDVCTKACRRGYHTCSDRDIVGGAYMVGRGMGWINSETRVWSAEDAKAAADTPSSSGLCMCCRDDE